MIDFKCRECGEVHEKFVDRETKQVGCSSCGGTCQRVISPVRSLMDPLSGHFHDATRKWEKHHEDMAKKGTE